jgi:transposase IS116/IS110/IS902 family protein
LLDTVPGIGQRAAEILLAELGTDLTRFPSAKHLASWAGACPGNKESGRKRLSGKTRKGNTWLRQVLIGVAHVASTTKDTYLAAQYRRIAARRGKKRALVALGHTILVIIYYILTRRVPVSGCAVSSRQTLEAASAESEGPSSPIVMRERVCVSWWGGFRHNLSALYSASILLLVGWTQASELPYLWARPSCGEWSGDTSQLAAEFFIYDALGIYKTRSQL